MANSLPLLVAPNTLILKLKLHCSRCERKLKSLMSNVQGVQSISIDSKQGTVTISGNVDPATIITLLGILGRKAEVLSEPRPSIDNDQNLQIIEQSKVLNDHHFNDPHVVAQLQQLSGIKGLKDVQVTYSKTIRLTLEGHENDLGDKNMEITIQDGVHSPQISCSGGLCGASASCCGSHGAPNRNLHGSCGCCHAVGQPHWATHGYGYIPQGPPPPWPGYVSPSAPPVMGYSPQASPKTTPPPPVMGYSSSFLSDDNPAGNCNIF